MTDNTQTAEYAHALELAGGDAVMLRLAAQKLHYNESMHMHDEIENREPCRYCWLRAGRVLAAVHDRVAPSISGLLDDARKLRALEAAGVDSWGGYGDAMAAMHDDEGEG